MSQFDSDEFGNPILNEWMTVAHIHSEEGLRWHNEMKAWREKNQQSNDSNQTIDTNFVPVGDITTPSDLLTVFHVDWKQINWKWLPFMLHEENESLLKNCFHINYDIICFLFAHYCGHGEGNRFNCL